MDNPLILTQTLCNCILTSISWWPINVICHWAKPNSSSSTPTTLHYSNSLPSLQPYATPLNFCWSNKYFRFFNYIISMNMRILVQPSLTRSFNPITFFIYKTLFKESKLNKCFFLFFLLYYKCVFTNFIIIFTKNLFFQSLLFLFLSTRF